MNGKELGQAYANAIRSAFVDAPKSFVGTLFGSSAVSAESVSSNSASSIDSSFNLGDLFQDDYQKKIWELQQHAALQQQEYQTASAERAMQFSADEAAKLRAWQTDMSNSAHQREVSDLKAAGLNPILSAMNGSGAAVPAGASASGFAQSGSKADVDTSNQMLQAMGVLMQGLSSASDLIEAIGNLIPSKKLSFGFGK